MIGDRWPEDCYLTPEKPPKAELVCENCGNEPPFEWFDSCIKCEAAYLIHGPKWALEESRKHYRGSPAWNAMEREMARQLEAIRSVA